MRLKIDWASLIVGSKFTVFALFNFTLYLRGIFQLQALGGLYLEGRFYGGFFTLPVWGALYLEGLIFGILRYCLWDIALMSGVSYGFSTRSRLG